MLGRVRRGVVGDSRYARRLRNGIHDAAQNPQRQPVLISGEPGLGKDNLAALIHYGSPNASSCCCGLKLEICRDRATSCSGTSAQAPC